MGETDKDDLIHILEDDIKDEAPPTSLSMMPVRDVVIFTDMLMPLLVGREKSVRAVDDAIGKDGYLFLATQKDPGTEDPKKMISTGSAPSAGFSGSSNCRMAGSRRWFRELPKRKLSGTSKKDLFTRSKSN